jgi:hypothetical protein
MHKTATTFLQEEVFSKIEDINFVDCETYFLEGIPEDNERITLVSCEELEGNPYFPQTIHRKIIFNGIKSIYPDARIILGIREKFSHIKSLYTQYVRKGGTKSFNEFKKEMLYSPKLDYDRLIETLRCLFGENNVLIYRYEDLKHDPKHCIKIICNYVDVSPPGYYSVV